MKIELILGFNTTMLFFTSVQVLAYKYTER